MVSAGGKYGTVLQDTSYGGNLKIVTLLLEKGADPNTRGTVVPPILQMYIDIAPAGGKYGTALQAALDWGNSEIAKLLLEKGADPNTQGACCAFQTMCG